MKIVVGNTGRREAHFIKRFAECMQKVSGKFDAKVVIDRAGKIPKTMIQVDGKIVGHIDYADNCKRLRWPGLIKKHNPSVIFKFHCDTTRSYMGDPRVIPCGIYKSASVPPNVLTRKRNVDITSRMKTWQSHKTRGFAIARKILCNTAQRLSGRYKVGVGRVGYDAYQKELANCKIGFNWAGFAQLNWRIPEYMAHGIVMITQPYGERYPFRDDIILEDDVNCVFCADPKNFKSAAIKLLDDPKRLQRLRENVVELWATKLHIKKHGSWIMNKLLN